MACDTGSLLASLLIPIRAQVYRFACSSGVPPPTPTSCSALGLSQNRGHSLCMQDHSRKCKIRNVSRGDTTLGVQDNPEVPSAQLLRGSGWSGHQRSMAFFSFCLGLPISLSHFQLHLELCLTNYFQWQSCAAMLALPYQNSSSPVLLSEKTKDGL